MVFRKILRGSFKQIRQYCSDKGYIATIIFIIIIYCLSCSQAKNVPTELCKESKSVKQEIFSREGDNGTAKTITGDVLPKDHYIFNAIGATEELLSYIGYLILI